MDTALQTATTLAVKRDAQNVPRENVVNFQMIKSWKICKEDRLDQCSKKKR